jgi:alpha-tubulin suppressor-like RCC1 family protein
MLVRGVISRAVAWRCLVGLAVAAGVLAFARPALAASSGVSAWGQGLNGELGDGYEYDSPVPVAVSGLNGVKAISTGSGESLALLEDGTVMAWGAPVGDVPVPVSGLSGVEAVAAGTPKLALLSDGTVMMWSGSETPKAVSGLSGVTAIAAGAGYSLALLSNGTVMAWGSNQSGQLGDGTTTNSEVPVAVSGLSEVTAISAVEYLSLALLKNGTVMEWGGGNGGPKYNDVPVAICAVGETFSCKKDLGGVIGISAGASQSLALLSDGTVVTWGSGTTEPAEVSGLSEVTAIAAGGEHNLALLRDGSVMAWGSNIEGELGDPSVKGQSLTPVVVSGLNGASAIAAGYQYSLAVGPPPVPLPQVLEVEPSDGAGGGGTAVTITGIKLAGVKAVRFGSSDAESFEVRSETSITAVAPPGSGIVDVTAESAAGTSPVWWWDEFDYAPTVTNLEPNAGFPAGGTAVTIKGKNFNDVSAVEFGSTPAASFEVLSENTIRAVSPAGTGIVDVAVQTRGGESLASSSSEGERFIYTATPRISSVTPSHGPRSGGTQVTITGSSFTGATAVQFGAAEAASFKVESETKIVAVSPAFTGEDPSVPVFVTSPGGTNRYECGEEEVGFIYEPVVTRVEPNSGPAAGGTKVTIEGADFEGLIWAKEPLCTLGFYVVKSVDFGSTAATSFNVVSGSEIAAVAPPGAGTVNVTVRGMVGSSPITLADQFSYGTPLVEGESVASVTEHDATLQAQVNPVGHETEYEFWLECTAQCESSAPERVGTGDLPPDSSGQAVSVDLHNLQSGSLYTYWVLAKSSTGKTEGPHEPFRALQPPPPAITGETTSEGLAAPVMTSQCCVQTGTSSKTPSTGKAFAFGGLSLRGAQRGEALAAQLMIASAGSRVAVEVTAPTAHAFSPRKRGKPKPLLLARLIRTNVAAGRLKLTVPLDANGRRALERHKHLALSVKITVTAPTGTVQTATRAVTLARR